MGRVAASENPIVKNAVITAFKAQYGIDMSIAEQSNALKFKSFNEFFTRALKEGVRDIDTDADQYCIACRMVRFHSWCPIRGR